MYVYMYVCVRVSGMDHPASAVSCTLTQLWIRKGCLKVEEGLEHFKAMLTSKLADAKSALCKWTAGTPKKKKKSKPGAEEDSTVLSIH